MQIRPALTALVALSLCLGCGPAPETGESTDPPRVALVMKSLANEFFKTIQDSARAHLEALLCANDSMALGVVAALRAAGRPHPRVVGPGRSG
jgi:ribose transport system substrate-binding protein